MSDAFIGLLVFRELRKRYMNRAKLRRHRKMARQLRLELVRLLGGKCEECDETNEGILEIDHIEGRDWEVRKMSSHRRVARYWQEYREGVPLQVLCKFCNSSKNQHVLYPREPGSDG